VVDQFTKWVECIPLPSQTAEVTADAMVNQVFCRLGIPMELMSDRGSNFESELFSEVCKLLHIHKTRTTAYRPSTNGQVERYNRTLMDAVRCYVGTRQNTWDIELPQIAAAMRSSVCRSTGFTANRMMLGREVYTPAELVYPCSPSQGLPVGDHVRELERSMVSAHETARKCLSTVQAHMKRDHDVRLNQVAHEVGEVVYVLNVAGKPGKAKKLLPQWLGPGVVVKKPSAFLYQVRLKGKKVNVNHDRMKKCRMKEFPTWILREQESCRKGADEANLPIYCVCRGMDDGSYMIACDWCEEWFHGRCVGVTEEEGEDIDLYKCPKCRSD
jgi:hypothetical protein